MTWPSSRHLTFFSSALTATLLWLTSAPAHGATVLFSDDFSGPNLDSTWQASLPTMKVAEPYAGSTQVTTYLGAPNTSTFQTLGSSSVLRMTSSLNDHQRRGWKSSTLFTANAFRYEVRFNTLTQSSATSIDAFLEIGLIDATNPGRYDIVSPYGGGFSSNLEWAAGSSIDNAYYNFNYNYQNNTWYRLVLEADPGQNIRASLYSDSGTELVGKTLAHTGTAFGSGFNIFLSQAMGEPLPSGLYPSDVAVDYAQVTSLVVPEPGMMALAGCGLVLLGITRQRR